VSCETTAHIDQDRVYLTGFSMGGYGTYRWASLHLETFAAIAPVSAAARQSGE
jgi:predicted peptidase